MSIEIVTGDRVFTIQPPGGPDYKANNPLNRLTSLVEKADLAAEREFYVNNQVQYLIPYDYLELYGPSDSNWNITDSREQDNKEDFQKQNLKDFRCTDTWIARGWATLRTDSSDADWTGPFLLLSYRGGPDSKLSQLSGHKLGATIKLYLKVGRIATTQLLDVPYNPLTNRYEIELWGYPGNDLRSHLDSKGVAAFDRGGLLARPDLAQGYYRAFVREGLDNRDMRTVAPSNIMHPVLPLLIEAAWADKSLTWWDSNGGQNYHYGFDMIFRGWDNFLKVGISDSPNGGFGFLHYRNLLSNYFDFRASGELGRDLQPWMFDASSSKSPSERREGFFAVDYIDLQILKPECGIGIHRHRDNQDILFMLEGTALIVTADWAKRPFRERCFEIRTIQAGSLSLVKPGQLHGLFNVTDENLCLLVFGGYD
jgi:hypothetical protein